MNIYEAKIKHDFLNGVIEGSDVITSTKLYKDAKSFYQSIDPSLNDETIMYDVYAYTQGDTSQEGNLNWGLTVMKPVYVNGECNITRGHFHENLNCAEIYMCFSGEGLLLFMDENNKCYAEKMSVGSVHHIDGKLAHRLVNTGTTDLKIGCCWPTTAGHDYKRIEEQPFSVRVFKKNNNIVIEE